MSDPTQTNVPSNPLPPPLPPSNPPPQTYTPPPPVTPGPTLPVSNPTPSDPPPTPPSLGNPPPVTPPPPSGLPQPGPALGSPVPSSAPPSASPPLANAKSSPIRKIIVLLLVVLLLALGGFAAYTYFLSPQDKSGSTSSTAPSSSTTLEYWGLWEPSSIMAQVFADFETEHPGVKVNYVQQSPKDYRDRLQAAFLRGDGPDIFRFHNTWVPMLGSSLDKLPNSVMSKQEFSSTFYPVATQDLTLDNSIVGIPLMIDGLGLYYNKAIFATAGKSPPKTWDELRSLASDLTIENGNIIERAGIALGTAGNVDHFSDILGLMLLQNGADPANPTNDLAQHAVQFYTIFSVTDKIWNSTLPNSTQAFASEKAAMMIGPSWRAHEIIDLNPQLDFAVIPLPQLPKINITWATYWVEGVWNQSPNKQLSWQLLQYLSSSEVMQRFYAAASEERTFGEPYSRVDLANQLKSDPIVGAFITQAPYAQSWPMASDTHDNGINDRIIKYYEDAVNKVNQGSSPESVLTTTAQGVTQVLSNSVAAP